MKFSLACALWSVLFPICFIKCPGDFPVRSKMLTTLVYFRDVFVGVELRNWMVSHF